MPLLMVSGMNGLFHSSAGFLNQSLMRLPNRRFIPDFLYQSVCSGTNLHRMGCLSPTLQGGSIAFSREQSEKAALGEVVERYASALYASDSFVVGSYRELRKSYSIPDLSCFRYYSDEQYQELSRENVFPLAADDVVEWCQVYDYLNGQNMLVPAFCVYMPYLSRIDSPHNYMVGATSTGISAGKDLAHALVGGFFECAERNDFARCWYLQEKGLYRQYTRSLILSHYGRHKRIKQLFSNPLVDFKVFDLSVESCMETILVFLFFRYKEHRYQSIGCASRFSKSEALLKATLEAYQGIEFAISLMEKKLLSDQPCPDELTNFDQHFHFYNKFPALRQHSRILREAQEINKGDDKIHFNDPKQMCRSFCQEELQKTNLKHLLYADITPVDVVDAGYKVVRAITPGWLLLSGCHRWPFLGGRLACEKQLFLEFPHPFP